MCAKGGNSVCLAVNVQEKNNLLYDEVNRKLEELTKVIPG